MTNGSSRNTPNPAMGMAYGKSTSFPSRGRKSLSAQLTELAAKRAVGRVVDAAARHAERALSRKLSNSHRNSQTNQHATRNKAMFNTPTTRQSSAGKAPARGANTRQNQEPVELWVNTVLIMEAGAEPVRIGNGRPLSTLKTDKPVTTSDEEYNRVNAISNAFAKSLIERSDKLDKGESFLVVKDGEQDTFTGITMQVYRAESDPEGDAAAAADIESQATKALGTFFG